MTEVTFRDFAMAVMQNQIDAAVGMLETLLGLSASHARKSTEFFKAQVGDPKFLPKAMGLRTAVTSGTDDQIGELMVDLFGLDAETRPTAVATVRKRYARA